METDNSKNNPNSLNEDTAIARINSFSPDDCERTAVTHS